jgi:hypothetical protein
MRIDEFYCHNPVLVVFYCQREGLHVGPRSAILSHALACKCPNCLHLLENWAKEIEKKNGLALP